MMAAAGLSVAYHAKPKVREAAMVAIDEGGLDRLLEVVTRLEPRASALRRIAASVVRLVITSAASRRWISAGRPAASAARSAGSNAAVVSTRSLAHQP